MSPKQTQRLVAVISVVLFAAKLVAWWLTSSVTVLSDALESIVNILASFIGLYSVYLAAKPRDADHPYGHGKVEAFSAGIEGTLIAFAGLLIIYGAAVHLLRPKELQRLDVGAVILAASGVVNWAVGRYAVGIGKAQKSLTVEAAGRHLQTDAWSTVALVGGLILLILTKWWWLDSVIAFGAAVFILHTGYLLLRRSIGVLMDETDVGLVREVIAVLQKHRAPQWIDLHNLRVIQAGNALHLDGHMTIPYYFDVRAAEIELHRLEDLMRAQFNDRAELFVHIDGCMPYQCKLCAVPDCPVRQEALRERLEWTLENVWEDSKHGKEPPPAPPSGE
jgi:cation diffusion facilitator family transporter